MLISLSLPDRTLYRTRNAEDSIVVLVSVVGEFLCSEIFDKLFGLYVTMMNILYLSLSTTSQTIRHQLSIMAAGGLLFCRASNFVLLFITFELIFAFFEV